MAVKMKLGKSEKIKLVQRGRAALELGYVRNLVIIVDRYKVCLISRICLYLESQDYHNNTEMIYIYCTIFLMWSNGMFLVAEEVCSSGYSKLLVFFVHIEKEKNEHFCNKKVTIFFRSTLWLCKSDFSSFIILFLAVVINL